MSDERVIYPPLLEHAKLRQALTAGEQKVFQMFNQNLPSDWEIYRMIICATGMIEFKIENIFAKQYRSA